MRVNKLKIRLITAILFIAILLITCPGRRAHKEALKNAVNKEFAKTAGITKENDSNAIKVMRQISDGFLETAINPNLTVMGYGLFSIGYIQTKGTKEMVSFGILHFVWIKDKENLINKVPLLKEPKPVTPQDTAV